MDKLIIHRNRIGSPIYYCVCKTGFKTYKKRWDGDKYLAASVPSRHLPDYPAGDSPSRPWRWRCSCFRFTSQQFHFPSPHSQTAQSEGLDLVKLLVDWVVCWPLGGRRRKRGTSSLSPDQRQTAPISAPPSATKRAHSTTFGHITLLLLGTTGGFLVLTRKERTVSVLTLYSIHLSGLEDIQNYALVVK